MICVEKPGRSIGRPRTMVGFSLLTVVQDHRYNRETVERHHHGPLVMPMFLTPEPVKAQGDELKIFDAEGS